MSVTETLIKNVTDEEGQLNVDSTTVDVNIRDENVTLYETESGSLVIESDELNTGTFLEIVPGPTGVETSRVTEPEVEIETIEPAEVMEEEVDSAKANIDVRYD